MSGLARAVAVNTYCLPVVAATGINRSEGVQFAVIAAIGVLAAVLHLAHANDVLVFVVCGIAVAGMAQENPARHRAFAMPAADAAMQHTGLRPAISTRSLPLRVILRHDTDDACKLVISGRMADVCAELDRLVELENKR